MKTSDIATPVSDAAPQITELTPHLIMATSEVLPGQANALARARAFAEPLLASETPAPGRMFAMTTRGSRSAFAMQFQPSDWLVFGSETSGLPAALRDGFPEAQRLRLPMREGQRSLNLSNAVAVTVFEAWRQNGFGVPAQG